VKKFKLLSLMQGVHFWLCLQLINALILLALLMLPNQSYLGIFCSLVTIGASEYFFRQARKNGKG